MHAKHARDGNCKEQSALLEWSNVNAALNGNVPEGACAVSLVMSPDTSAAGCAGEGTAYCPGTFSIFSDTKYNFFAASFYTTGRPDVSSQTDFDTWMTTAIQLGGDSTSVSEFSETLTSLLTTYLRSDEFTLWIDMDPALSASVNPNAGGGCLFWKGQSLGGLSVVAFATAPPAAAMQ